MLLLLLRISVEVHDGARVAGCHGVCPAHPIMQVVKVVALPRLQLLLELLVRGRLVLIGEVDGVDEGGIVRMLRPKHFLADRAFLG